MVCTFRRKVTRLSVPIKAVDIVYRRDDFEDKLVTASEGMSFTAEKNDDDARLHEQYREQYHEESVFDKAVKRKTEKISHPKC